MEFYNSIAPIIFSDDPSAVPTYLVDRKLLPDGCNCIHCNQPMQLRTRPTKDTSDGFGFRCINGNCSKRLTTRSIRAGSFFEKSRVPLAKWLYFLYLWCQDTMVKKAAETTGISKRTTLQVYQYIRDICTTKLLHN